MPLWRTVTRKDRSPHVHASWKSSWSKFWRLGIRLRRWKSRKEDAALYCARNSHIKWDWLGINIKISSLIKAKEYLT